MTLGGTDGRMYVHSCALILIPGTKTNLLPILIWSRMHVCMFKVLRPATSLSSSTLPDMNHLEPTHSEPNELPLSLTPNHISLSDMGTPGQTHTPSFSLCLSTQINSHSSRALSCLKLHLWIIDRLLPQRPQCGIMRIKTRAEKAGWEKCKSVEQRRRADTQLIPTPGQKPIKTPVLWGCEVIVQNDDWIFL